MINTNGNSSITAHHVRSWISSVSPCLSPKHDIQDQDFDFRYDEYDDQMESPQTSRSIQSKKSLTDLQLRIHLDENGLIIDNAGAQIPDEIRPLVNTILARGQDPLSNQDHVNIRKMLLKFWNDNEDTALPSILLSPLLAVNHEDIKVCNNRLWSSAPVPRSRIWPTPIITPKTDVHYGFCREIFSKAEKVFIFHPDNDPYCVPTGVDIFPSFLVEAKSEACQGTIYKAESQLAVAGAHRGNSMRHLMEMGPPNMNFQTLDSVVFSLALSPRLAVSYVHFHIPGTEKYHMSFLDSYYLIKDEDQSKCRQYLDKVINWMTNEQEKRMKKILGDIIEFQEQESARKRIRLDVAHNKYQDLNVKQLHDQLKARGIPAPKSHVKKDRLIRLLEDADSSQ
ncbi:hypothetical protein N7495_004633 [Penicillium taxi]|uniref:uncharacterized protein n=1 Tax=Penicillium taxi TaxID=168475 RepID=UPI002544F20E|nr:uncharacterized protein N7495_004633 [Penicillium taxi]KAJ5899889.1 hypothetical protein N7495_004633 [Penicillium taxi]